MNPILAFLSTSSVTALVTWLISRQKSKAEIEKIQADTDTVQLANLNKLIDIYKGATDDLKKEVQELRQEVKQLRFENFNLKSEIAKLERRLGEFQHT